MGVGICLGEGPYDHFNPYFLRIAHAKNKLFFVSPYATNPKKMALRKFFFHDLEIIFFFIHQNLYLSLEDFSLLQFFVTFPYNSIAKF